VLNASAPPKLVAATESVLSRFRDFDFLGAGGRGGGVITVLKNRLKSSKMRQIEMKRTKDEKPRIRNREAGIA